MAEAFCGTWAPSLKTLMYMDDPDTMDCFLTLSIDIIYSAAWGSDALVCSGT